MIIFKSRLKLSIKGVCIYLCPKYKSHYHHSITYEMAGNKEMIGHVPSMLIRNGEKEKKSKSSNIIIMKNHQKSKFTIHN